MKKKLLIVTFLIAILTFNTTAYAKTIAFEISRDNGAFFVTNNKKDLTGSKWKISNANTMFSNFRENVDVIGFRTRSTSKAPLSAYHTFSKFVHRYELPYTNTPSMRQELRLYSQIDSTSSSQYLQIQGEWIS